MTSESSPRISVVIPSYNHAAFVEQAIESVLRDQGEEVELIVVDDASTDGSAKRVAVNRDPHLRLIELPANAGTSAALNAGIKASHGAYIGVLGSDDFFLPGTLRKQLDFLDSHPQYDAVFGMPRMVGEAGEALNTGYAEFAHPFVGVEASRAAWLRQFFMKGNCVCHPTAMLRRQVHETVGLYDPRLLNLSDFDLWVRMLAAGLSFFVMPDELTNRRIRSNRQNLSAAKPSTSLRTAFEITQILKPYRGLAASYLYEVFANEVGVARIPPGLPSGVLLADIASRSSFRPMQYFALESLYQHLGSFPEANCTMLFRLAERIDPFALAPKPVPGPARPPQP